MAVLPMIILAMGLAVPPDVPADLQIVQDGKVYAIRTLDSGLPVYTFDKDQGAKSSCVDSCATAWPPVLVKQGKAGKDWTIVTRADGSRQWAYKGKPVYTFSRDTEGRATGDGAGGAWHLLPTFAAD